MLDLKLPDRFTVNYLVTEHESGSVSLMLNERDWAQFLPTDKYLFICPAKAQVFVGVDDVVFIYSRDHWEQLIQLLRNATDDPAFACFQSWIQFDPSNEPPLDRIYKKGGST